MATVLPNYEYDIFISYRHNDNRSGWVSEFVKDLREELATVIKDPVSIYFDTNFQDGLLETHNVNKSLENKLRSFILVPIISQTYCDTNSFAWQNEFCAFNRMALGDEMGREIKLHNGNVASRILPVKIHDLETEDITLLETELGGVLRGIEFIYKEPGINRPLAPRDNRADNYNKTDYHNQLNKLAHAIKEIIYGILKPTSEVAATSTMTTRQIEEENKTDKPSIAVLPFLNRNKDADQDYLSDGITENIILELATNKNIRTITRTSAMRYKNSDKTAPEIAAELRVKYILEGGVQTHKEQVRINVQLVDAEKDEYLWSKVFMETMDDIFALQTQVAELVVGELNTSLQPRQEKAATSKGTQNTAAYDLWMKGRHAFNRWSVEGYKTAAEYFQQAVDLDPSFVQAYSGLASAYSARMSWNGDLSPAEALKYIEANLEQVWKYGPTANDYLTRGFVGFFIYKDFRQAEEDFHKAIETAPNDANAIYAYCYLLNMEGRYGEADEWLARAESIDPLTPALFNYRAMRHYLQGNTGAALQVLDEGLKLYPGVLRFYDYQAKVFLANKQYQEALDATEKGLATTTLRPPSLVAWRAAACFLLEKTNEGEQLTQELINRSKQNEKGVNIYLCCLFAALSRFKEAEEWLQKSESTNDVDLVWRHEDPLLEGLRVWLKDKEKHGPDYGAAEREIIALLEEKMPPLPYHNLEHIRDVVEAAARIGKEEGITEDEQRVLRLAAFYHDAGFTVSGAKHEERGAELAKAMLPRHGFDEETINRTCGMIMATQLPQTPQTRLEKILCDADLEYLGRDDFYETGNKLFLELKEQGLVEDQREWNIMQRTFLQSHRFHTEYGKMELGPNKQARQDEITDNLKKR